MNKGYCNMIFRNSGKSQILKKQRSQCEMQHPDYFSTIPPPANKGLGTGLGNINTKTGKLILQYASKQEAIHSKGPQRGKLKKGYRYVGNGYIIKTNNNQTFLPKQPKAYMYSNASKSKLINI